LNYFPAIVVNNQSIELDPVQIKGKKILLFSNRDLQGILLFISSGENKKLIFYWDNKNCKFSLLFWDFFWSTNLHRAPLNIDDTKQAT